MKSFIKYFGIVICSIILGFAVMQDTKTYNVKASTTESSCVQFGIDELAGGYSSDGTTITKNEGKGNTYSVANYGRFGFAGPYENVEIATTLNFASLGSGTHTSFALRAQGEALAPVADAGWTNKGYWFRWYSHGQFDFAVDGTKIYSSKWGPLPSIETNTNYNMLFKTVNTVKEDLTPVCQITISINESVFVSYETETVLDGGWFAISSDGTSFTASGNHFSCDPINLSDVATPIKSANFSSEISSNGTVTTSTGSYSGAGYLFQLDDAYSIKTQFKPTELGNANASLKLTVGAKKSNSTSLNRFDVLSEQWGWADSGYTASWSANGTGAIFRNATKIAEASNLPTFEMNETYDIVCGYKHFIDGSNLVYLMIDNKLAISYLDLKTKTNTPLVPTKSGTPAGLLTYSLIVAYSCASQIIPYENIVYSVDTLIAKDLGTPSTHNSGADFDRNNQVSSFNGGIVAMYPMAEKNSSIKFKANFTTTGSHIVFQLRATGTIDTPWGGGWTNRGYTVYLHSSGQITLLKDKITLCEGWATGGFSLTANTDHIIEIGTVNLTNNIIKFFVKVNDVVVVNFVDIKGQCNEIGNLIIYSTGYAGSLNQVGYNLPTISANVNEARINDEITLSYAMEGQTSEDVVEYLVDETKSTATATIENGKLKATTSGNLVVYGCINGLYSNDVTITIQEELKASVINLPEQPIIVGGQKVKIDGCLSDDSIQITSKIFSIENGTGQATIDAQSGEITAISAGSVNVFVTINGIKSDSYLLIIIPIIEVGNTTAMAVGEKRDLSYSSNCDLPNENIIVSYELIEGESNVDLNTTNGKIEALNIGTFKIRVSVKGQTFSAVSEVVTISIEAPVVVLFGVKDIVVGETLELSPSINEGIEIISCKLIATQGSDHISINGNKITGKSSGIVFIKAVVNGFESSERQLVVNALVPTIIVPSSFPINETTTLSVMFNSSYVPTNVEYSIVTGSSLASIVGNVLTSLSNVGKIKIKAVIDDEYIAYANVTIVKISPIGIQNNQTVYIGSEIKISYNYYGDDAITSIEYKLIKGQNCATLTTLDLQAGETILDKKATLKVNSLGEIKVQIIINGNIKETVSLNAKKQTIPNDGEVLAILLYVGIALIVIAIIILAIYLRKRNKKKALANSNPNLNDETNDKGAK